MSTPTPIDVNTSKVHEKDALETEKLGVDVVVTRISVEDLVRISGECLDIHSPTGWRIDLITLVMPGGVQYGWVNMPTGCQFACTTRHLALAGRLVWCRLGCGWQYQLMTPSTAHVFFSGAPSLIG
jgi:hypothetical protein